MSTAFLADPIAKEHDPGPGHPEQPARWDAAVKGLGNSPLTHVAPRAATEDEIALCHTHGYIATARRDVQSGAHALSTGDTDINRRSFDVALRATGTCLNGVDLVMEGKANNAFCIVRPPGHHASAARGMGFCLFNNIAIAARYAQRKYGVERVAIADWDVHHGNGTQDIFYEDGSVFFFSALVSRHRRCTRNRRRPRQRLHTELPVPRRRGQRPDPQRVSRSIRRQDG
jgi:acetoin utilization deacetylase AcuC-like enzyme